MAKKVQWAIKATKGRYSGMYLAWKDVYYTRIVERAWIFSTRSIARSSVLSDYNFNGPRGERVVKIVDGVEVA